MWSRSDPFTLPSLTAGPQSTLLSSVSNVLSLSYSLPPPVITPHTDTGRNKRLTAQGFAQLEPEDLLGLEQLRTSNSLHHENSGSVLVRRTVKDEIECGEWL